MNEFEKYQQLVEQYAGFQLHKKGPHNPIGLLSLLENVGTVAKEVKNHLKLDKSQLTQARKEKLKEALMKVLYHLTCLTVESDLSLEELFQASTAQMKNAQENRLKNPRKQTKNDSVNG